MIKQLLLFTMLGSSVFAQENSLKSTTIEDLSSKLKNQKPILKPLKQTVYTKTVQSPIVKPNVTTKVIKGFHVEYPN